MLYRILYSRLSKSDSQKQYKRRKETNADITDINKQHFGILINISYIHFKECAKIPNQNQYNITGKYFQ
jgi:hypothetical protein